MENTQDFVINKGVLNSYRGPSGEVTIPEGVKEIGREAFSGCTGLTSVTIPEGVTKIGESAFEDCTGLTSVTIPKGVKEIGWNAFEGCTGLTSVTIPKGVKTIDKSIFENSCLAIIAPHIPVTGFDAADKPGACAGFAKLYLDGAEIDEEIKAGYLKCIKGQKKRLYPLAVKHEELLQLMLAEKMLARKDIDPLLEECGRQSNIAAKTTVLNYAGKSLKPVDPVKEMEREFAAMERSAKNVEEFQATGVMKVGEAKKLFRYKKLEEGGLVITGYKGTDTAVVIPGAIGKDQVTEIGIYAFSGCKGLTSVTIPAGVKKIGDWTFYDCTGLTSVTIQEGVKEIGSSAFSDCTGLTSVTIPKSVTAIRKSIFENSCPAIIAPHIPVGGFDAADKPGACCGFAKLYLDGAEIDEEIKAGYLKYIKGQKKKLYPAAVKHEELLQLMFAEKMIPRKDIDLLLEECDKQKNAAAKATVLEYTHQFDPVDTGKTYKL